MIKFLNALIFNASVIATLINYYIQNCNSQIEINFIDNFILQNIKQWLILRCFSNMIIF